MTKGAEARLRYCEAWNERIAHIYRRDPKEGDKSLCGHLRPVVCWVWIAVPPESTVCADCERLREEAGK